MVSNSLKTLKGAKFDWDFVVLNVFNVLDIAFVRQNAVRHPNARMLTTWRAGLLNQRCRTSAGWFRWASGSTSLTIVMHVLINAEAILETTIKVELLS
jgi:hypothetical protein